MDSKDVMYAALSASLRWRSLVAPSKAGCTQLSDSLFRAGFVPLLLDALAVHEEDGVVTLQILRVLLFLVRCCSPDATASTCVRRLCKPGPGR